MSSKKYLSNKKTAQQTISISPSLKDWISRYVHVNHGENPDDGRYKSISSFYNYIMENVLNLFKKGKTFEDFNRNEEKKEKEIKLTNFFDRFTFKATIPLYEMAIEPSKYSHFSFEFTTRFLFSYLSFFRGLTKSLTYEDFLMTWDRIKSHYGTTNVSKDLRLEIFPNKTGGYARGYFEFEGKYKNLHFENCKYFAAIFGILGIRVTDFTYSANDYYCSMDLLATDLIFKEKLDREERLKLSAENVDFIINYSRMLDERDMYLWMKLSEDNGVAISFSNQKIFNRWIKKVEENLRKFGRKEDFLVKILKFFNKLHWIRIENVKDLSFKTEQLIEKNIEQKQYLFKYLSKNAELSEVDGIYYLR